MIWTFKHGESPCVILTLPDIFLFSFSEDDLEILIENMKLYTEETMKIERAPWLPEDFMDMDDLYTQLTVQQLCNKPKGPKSIKIDDYRDLFDDKLLVEVRQMSQCKSQIDRGLPAKNVSTKPRKKKYKKVLFKGEQGMGKTTLSKKITLDWARGVFTTFSIILLVSLKLVSPGDPIENVIIDQNSWLEDLNVTQCRLKEIFAIFGDKCLVILDGLDECVHGKNEDVVKILKGRNLLNCNIVVTSRPHSIDNVKKHFDVIAVVDGFTEKNARQFASKILSDERQIDAVMRFDPYRKNEFDDRSISEGDYPCDDSGQESYDDSDYDSSEDDTDLSMNNKFESSSYLSNENETFSKHVYNCPILLSFLCVMVQRDQIDLCSPTMSFGAIYFRMIRCLYMKYLRRQPVRLDFCLNQFVDVLMALGKLAFESLLTGNSLLQRSYVIKEAGHNAFDYGLLIGHEDADKLLPDETADIFVTFPHRSIQEFLGAFFFVLSLENGQSIDSLLGVGCTRPIFMENALFFHFCTWLIFSFGKIFRSNTLETALDSMKHCVLNLINFSQLDVCNIARLYPAIDVAQAYHRGDTSNLQFFKELLSACNRVRNIELKSEKCAHWMSDCASFIPKSVPTITFGISQYELPCRADSDKTVVINLSDFETQDKDTFTFVQNIVHNLENHGTVGVYFFRTLDKIICNQFLKKQVQELHIVGYSIDGHLVSLSDIDYCPSLTHLSLPGITLAAQVCLTKALRKDKLPNLTNLCIIDTDLRDDQVINAVTPCSKLTSLNLSYSSLSTSGCQAIASLSNRLISLMITAECLPEQELMNSFFQGPWHNLTSFSFHGESKYFYHSPFRSSSNVMQTLKSNTIVPDVISVVNLVAMPLISQILLTSCIASESDLSHLTKKIAKWKISKLDISHSSGITGKLSTVFVQTLQYLHTLILSDCGLNAQDVSSLTEASMTGRLPELKHVNLSENKDLDLRGLFDHSYKWSQLESVSISLTDRISDFKWLAGGVQSGCINFLQQLQLWVRDDDIFTCNTTWRHLQKIEIFRQGHSNSENVRTVISHMADAYEKGHLPNLRTVMIGLVGMVEFSVAEEVSRLRKHNIDVYVGEVREYTFLNKMVV